MTWFDGLLVAGNLLSILAAIERRAEASIALRDLHALRKRLPDIRQHEVDAYSDWLMEHGERAFRDYAHKRGGQIDKTRGGDV